MPNLNTNLTLKTIQNEIWKDIIGYKKLYQISNFGRVKSLNRKVNAKNGSKRKVPERIIKQHFSKNGYYYFTLSKNSIHITARVHQLVAKTFILNPKNKPQVNHKDGNKLNNNFNNLEWTTVSENVIHAHKIGLINRKRTKLGKFK